MSAAIHRCALPGRECSGEVYDCHECGAHWSRRFGQWERDPIPNAREAQHAPPLRHEAPMRRCGCGRLFRLVTGAEVLCGYCAESAAGADADRRNLADWARLDAAGDE